jgi:hypothetical protein
VKKIAQNQGLFWMLIRSVALVASHGGSCLSILRPPTAGSVAASGEIAILRLIAVNLGCENYVDDENSLNPLVGRE